MSISITQMCDHVKETLGLAEGIMRAQSIGDLTEDYPDLPLMQVYWENSETDVMGGTADRSTFRGGVRVNETQVTVDVPCRQRSHIDEDITAVTEIADAIIDILDAQNVKPYFGLAGIQGFRWRCERVNFSRGDPNIIYPGLKFTIWLRVF